MSLRTPLSVIPVSFNSPQTNPPLQNSELENMLISRGSIFIHETVAFTSQRDITAMVIEVQTRLATELTASRNNSKVDSKPERKQKRGVKDAKIKSPRCLILRISSPRLQPRWIFCNVRSKNTGCDSTFGTMVRNQPILPLGKSSVVVGLLKLLILPLILSCNAHMTAC
jgi:hypothetical protein